LTNDRNKAFVCGMKMNRRFSVLLTAALFLLSICQGRCQDANTSGDQTNAPSKLKERMLKNDVVTNTVGIVLVKISPTLWAGKYEVTQDSYQKVMHQNPSAFSGADHPVDSVSWNDAMAFCKKLTEMEKQELPEGYAYSLPTEAQWEMLVDDASLKDAVMTLNGNSDHSTSPVGTLAPNKYGLYDMRGNVMEWCLDSHDPTAYKVLRGGAWDTFLDINARIDFRNYAAPTDAKNDYGFRVVLEPAASTP